jgi:hypothetical protein
MEWKECGRRRPFPALRYYPGHLLDDWEKPCKPSVRIAEEIRREARYIRRGGLEL